MKKNSLFMILFLTFFITPLLFLSFESSEINTFKDIILGDSIYVVTALFMAMSLVFLGISIYYTYQKEPKE